MPPLSRLNFEALPNLRRLRSNGRISASLDVQFCPTVTFHPFERDRLFGYTPSRFVAQDKLDQTPSDQLTWEYSSHTSRNIFPLAVTRNKLSRKWNDAMRKALRANGYDSHGQLPPIRHGRPKRSGLKGTLVVMIHNAFGMKESPDILLENAKEIVKMLERKASESEKAESA